ncbi:MAG: metallopeptidase TldD-related protein [Spirochaetia bacterium]|jgi:predicted Zn-dependent protease|nr:metallopeptidase TldD-related protein [Spirochaetia bacterium]
MNKVFKQHFEAVSAFVLGELRTDETGTGGKGKGEQAALSYSAEESAFMRFNNAKVRQSGTVTQCSLGIKLWKGPKSYSFQLGLSGDIAKDEEALAQALGQARATLPLLPDDPYQAVPEAADRSEVHYPGSLVPREDIPARILQPAAGMDFTGIYSQGLMCRGSANSAGARHWFSTETFLVDYSAWLPTGKAVKSTFAGRDWNDQAYAARLAETRRSLENLGKPEKVLQPGKYRAFISADAMMEFIPFFSWDGLGERGIRQGDSAYLALREGRDSFSPIFGVSQDFGLGVEPAFNEDGELAPQGLRLIDGGKLANTLVCSRTAKQYDLVSNNAPESEEARSIAIDAGDLPEADALTALGTGVYISNFHYLNWSDPATARVTGMTRFACLWVEDGRIVGPMKDMRWDESLYELFGSNLERVTKERHLVVENLTYDQRMVGGSLVPGILVNGLNFTL